MEDGNAHSYHTLYKVTQAVALFSSVPQKGISESRVCRDKLRNSFTSNLLVYTGRRGKAILGLDVHMYM